MSEIISYTEQQWITNNKDAIDWYYQNYPFLRGFKLPLPFEFLRDFYMKDMSDRNLPVNMNYANTYDFVFSYFLENYTKPLTNKFQGKTWLQYLWDNFPSAFKKSFTDINNEIFKPIGQVFSFFINPYIIFFILIAIAIILLYR